MRVRGEITPPIRRESIGRIVMLTTVGLDDQAVADQEVDASDVRDRNLRPGSDSPRSEPNSHQTLDPRLARMVGPVQHTRV